MSYFLVFTRYQIKPPCNIILSVFTIFQRLFMAACTVFLSSKHNQPSLLQAVVVFMSQCLSQCVSLCLCLSGGKRCAEGGQQDSGAHALETAGH